MIQFNCVPFHTGNFSQMKEFAPIGCELFHLRAVPYGMENHYYHIRWPPLNITILITQVRNCVMGATPMDHAMYNECYTIRIRVVYFVGIQAMVKRA